MNINTSIQHLKRVFLFGNISNEERLTGEIH